MAKKQAAKKPAKKAEPTHFEATRHIRHAGVRVNAGDVLAAGDDLVGMFPSYFEPIEPVNEDEGE